MANSQPDIFSIDAPTSPSGPPPLPPRSLETIPPEGSPEPLRTVDETERTPSPGKPPPRGAKIIAIAAGVACLALIAGGAVLYKQRGDARDRAAALAAEKQDLSDALELHRTSAIDLNGKLATCNEELTEGKTEIQTRADKVAALEAELVQTRTAVASLEQQQAEVSAVTRQFQKMIDSGKLDVVFRRGQLIVKLPARVLFSSGSAEVSEGGKKALADVAAILKPMRRKFTVAGHTDNVPISKPFKSNWELSAARAVAVVDVLTGAGVPGRRLVAAGFGPYAPIARNRTARGRQKNRRIEIILEPNLAPAVRAAQRAKKTKKGSR